MAGSVVLATISHRSRGVVKTKVAITVDASGNATGSVVGVGFGRLVAVGYAPGTFATGVDITVSDTDSGKAILTLTNAGTSPRYFRPTAVITTNAGAAVTAAGTAVDVNRDIFVGGKISVAVAQGGVSTSGTLYLVVDEEGLGNPALTV